MNANTVPTETTRLGNDDDDDDTLPVDPTDWRMANIDIIMMSSITATPNIIEDASCFIRSNSSSILITMTVLVTEIANAKKRLLYTE